MRKSEGHSMKRILQRKSQFISLIVTLLVLAILVPFTLATIQFLSNAKKNCPEGYIFPSFNDFWFTGVTTVFFYIMESLSVRFLYPWYYTICKEKKDEVSRQRRSRKAANNIYKFLFYTTSCIIGWCVMRDSFIFPGSLGGTGDLYNLF